MRKAKHPVALVVSILAAILLVSALVYCFVLPRVVLVSDTALSLVLPGRTIVRIGFEYLKHGYGIRVVKLDDSVFREKEYFLSSLEDIGSGFVVLGPLSTAFAVHNEIDVSGLLEGSIVFGIGTVGEGLFDCLLVPEEESGWDRASQLSEVGYGKVSLVRDVTGIPDGLQTEQWIVDYRYAPAVPKQYLKGVVIPDFAGILSIAGSMVKGENKVLGLECVYEER